MDADDWLAPDATAVFLRLAQPTRCDLAVSWLYRVDGDRRAARRGFSFAEALERLRRKR